MNKTFETIDNLLEPKLMTTISDPSSAVESAEKVIPPVDNWFV